MTSPMDFMPLVNHTSPSVCEQMAKNNTINVFIDNRTGASVQKCLGYRGVNNTALQAAKITDGFNHALYVRRARIWDERSASIEVRSTWGRTRLACGTPLVTADTPAARELLVDGMSALLVPAGNPQALAAAVRRLADDGGLARRIGDEGLAAYREHASEAVLGKRWRGLVEQLVTR